MSLTSPTLHLVCGKVASGKSSLAAKLGSTEKTVIIAEDDWLAALYLDEMSSISDYVRNAARLQNVIGPHIASLLNAGVSVVLDFQANTIARRTWMRGIIQETKVAHKLHYLDVTDEICIARLRARNAKVEHPFAVTDEQFLQLSKHFIAPSIEEGFDIVLHHLDDA